MPTYAENFQAQDNIVQWLPLTPRGSKFSPSFKGSLEDIYTTHIDKYQSNILVAFGTTFYPTDYTVERILAAAKLMPDTGFIIGMRDKDHQKMITDQALPNILMEPFIPQKELLAHSKVVAFISHGGGNSIYESLYFGTPIVGLPSGVDQNVGCQRA